MPEIEPKAHFELEIELNRALFNLRQEILKDPQLTQMERNVISKDVMQGFFDKRADTDDERYYIRHMADGFRIWSRHLWRVGTILNSQEPQVFAYYMKAVELYIDAARALEKL